MSLLRIIASGLHALFRKERLERDDDEELREYLKMAIDDKTNGGMSSEQARRNVRLETGGLEAIKEEVRNAVRESLLETVWRDLRFGARMLRRNPGFTAIAVLTLAICIGANTAVFSIMNTTLLRPLPFRKSAQIVLLWGTNAGGFGWRGKTGFSAPNFLDFREQNQVFEHMATFNSARFALTGEDDPQFIDAGIVTSDFFKVLDVQPVLGRALLPEDEQAGRDHVALLNYSLWRGRYGSDPNIAGRIIKLDAIPYIVIGVMPDFEFSIPGYYQQRDLWLPALLPRDNAGRGHDYLGVIAHLKPGVTLQRAQVDADAIMARLGKAYPKDISAGDRTLVVNLHDQIVGDIRPVVLILFGAAGFLLLIACANVANLQLARAAVRQKEIALRTALGASRARVLRQMLTESVLLAGIGWVLGVLLASMGIDLLLRLQLVTIPGGMKVTMDSWVLLYSMAISLLAGIVFGLAPALSSSSLSMYAPLKEGVRTFATAHGGAKLRSVLIITEVALSMILLIGAGLLLRSLVRLVDENPGFDTKNILTLHFNLPKYSFSQAFKQAAFYQQLMEKVGSLPGIIAVGATNDLPLTGGQDSDSISVEGHGPINTSSHDLAVQDRLATPEYFRVMGIPLIAGRTFTEADAGSAPPVALINRTFANRIFGKENPIGKRLTFGTQRSFLPWVTIVGIVGDIRDFGLDRRPSSEIYVPYLQQNLLPYNPLPHMHLVMRTTGDPNSLVTAVFERIHELDRELPIPMHETMEGVYAGSLAERRAIVLLLGVLAGIAIILVAVGVYGVISYSVARRTHEVGIRIALGAQARDIAALILGEGLTLALAGALLGLAGAISVTHVLSAMLYGVSATDTTTFLGIACLLIVVALLASYIPARRAMRVDPLVALRSE
ncbi:MAG: ABC transporter permease [Acidobacteriota bacterium]|jgi:putative ABC transport system permease protein